MEKCIINKKTVSLLGINSLFGRLTALLLKQSNAIKSISLYDDCDITAACDVANINTPCKVRAFQGKDQLSCAIKNADVILVADSGNYYCDSPAIILEDGASRIVEIGQVIAESCTKAIILVLANPINSTLPLLTQVLTYYNAYDCNKVIGVTAVDNVRANSILARHLQIDPRKVILPVVGGNSPDTRVPIFSQSRPNGKLRKRILKKITKEIKYSDQYIYRNKSELEAVNKAYATNRFVHSVLSGLRGEPNIAEIALTRSLLFPGTTYFAHPFILGPCGVQYRFPLPELSIYEEKILSHAIVELDRDCKKGEKYFYPEKMKSKTDVVECEEKQLIIDKLFNHYRNRTKKGNVEYSLMANKLTIQLPPHQVPSKYPIPAEIEPGICPCYEGCNPLELPQLPVEKRKYIPYADPQYLICDCNMNPPPVEDMKCHPFGKCKLKSCNDPFVTCPPHHLMNSSPPPCCTGITSPYSEVKLEPKDVVCTTCQEPQENHSVSDSQSCCEIQESQVTVHECEQAHPQSSCKIQDLQVTDHESDQAHLQSSCKPQKSQDHESKQAHPQSSCKIQDLQVTVHESKQAHLQSSCKPQKPQDHESKQAHSQSSFKAQKPLNRESKQAHSQISNKPQKPQDHESKQDRSKNSFKIQTPQVIDHVNKQAHSQSSCKPQKPQDRSKSSCKTQKPQDHVSKQSHSQSSCKPQKPQDLESKQAHSQISCKTQKPPEIKKTTDHECKQDNSQSSKSPPTINHYKKQEAPLLKQSTCHECKQDGTQASSTKKTSGKLKKQFQDEFWRRCRLLQEECCGKNAKKEAKCQDSKNKNTKEVDKKKMSMRQFESLDEKNSAGIIGKTLPPSVSGRNIVGNVKNIYRRNQKINNEIEKEIREKKSGLGGKSVILKEFIQPIIPHLACSDINISAKEGIKHAKKGGFERKNGKFPHLLLSSHVNKTPSDSFGKNNTDKTGTAETALQIYAKEEIKLLTGRKSRDEKKNVKETGNKIFNIKNICRKIFFAKPKSKENSPILYVNRTARSVNSNVRSGKSNKELTTNEDVSNKIKINQLHFNKKSKNSRTVVDRKLDNTMLNTSSSVGLTSQPYAPKCPPEYLYGEYIEHKVKDVNILFDNVQEVAKNKTDVASVSGTFPKDSNIVNTRENVQKTGVNNIFPKEPNIVNTRENLKKTGVNNIFPKELNIINTQENVQKTGENIFRKEPNIINTQEYVQKTGVNIYPKEPNIVNTQEYVQKTGVNNIFPKELNKVNTQENLQKTGVNIFPKEKIIDIRKKIYKAGINTFPKKPNFFNNQSNIKKTMIINHKDNINTNFAELKEEIEKQMEEDNENYKKSNNVRYNNRPISIIPLTSPSVGDSKYSIINVSVDNVKNQNNKNSCRLCPSKKPERRR